MKFPGHPKHTPQRGGTITLSDGRTARVLPYNARREVRVIALLEEAGIPATFANAPLHGCYRALFATEIAGEPIPRPMPTREGLNSVMAMMGLLGEEDLGKIARLYGETLPPIGEQQARRAAIIRDAGGEGQTDV